MRKGDMRVTGGVWFTADSHFGHKAMAAEGKGWRPFATVVEHDEFLISQWNKVVRPDDQVWHLGDVGMNTTHTLGIVARLNGTKHLVAGNHDEVWPGHREAYKHQARWLEVFASVQPFARRRIDGRAVLLCHFPYFGDHLGKERYAQWRLPDMGDWLLCGHVHGDWAQRGRQVNVGVDVRGWRPVHVEEVAKIIANGETS